MKQLINIYLLSTICSVNGWDPRSQKTACSLENQEVEVRLKQYEIISYIFVDNL